VKKYPIRRIFTEIILYICLQPGFKTKLREKFARVKVLLDFAFGKKPKFLGEKIIID